MSFTAVERVVPRRIVSQRPIAWWLILCCAMIFFMVVIGGITRLTESGLSITEWQPIAGILPPLSTAAWQEAFAKYQTIPQFQAIHSDMSLADFKAIYFWEYLHRLWGRLIGIVFALPFLYFLIRGRISWALAPKLTLIFVLGGLQGALGWYMVESGLEHRIEVSQYRLAAHLFAALLIYGAMFWVALDLFWPRPEPARGWRSVALRRVLNLILFLVAATLIAGAFVAGLRAGYIYNSFPLMGGNLVPSDYAVVTPFWLNWFESPAAAQFDHRILAETTWLVIALTWLYSRGLNLLPRTSLALDLLVVVATLQAVLGIATLVFVMPLPVAVTHQAGAVLLVTTALFARHTMRRKGG